MADSDYLRVAQEPTTQETVMLPAIENVRAELVTGEGALGDKATVTWDAADNIATYRIYRGTSEDFTVETGTWPGPWTAARPPSPTPCPPTASMCTRLSRPTTTAI